MASTWMTVPIQIQFHSHFHLYKLWKNNSVLSGIIADVSLESLADLHKYNSEFAPHIPIAGLAPHIPIADANLQMDGTFLFLPNPVELGLHDKSFLIIKLLANHGYISEESDPRLTGFLSHHWWLHSTRSIHLSFLPFCV